MRIGSLQFRSANHSGVSYMLLGRDAPVAVRGDELDLGVVKITGVSTTKIAKIIANYDRAYALAKSILMTNPPPEDIPVDADMFKKTLTTIAEKGISALKRMAKHELVNLLAGFVGIIERPYDTVEFVEGIGFTAYGIPLRRIDEVLDINDSLKVFPPDDVINFIKSLVTNLVHFVPWIIPLGLSYAVAKSLRNRDLKKQPLDSVIEKLISLTTADELLSVATMTAFNIDNYSVKESALVIEEKNLNRDVKVILEHLGCTEKDGNYVCNIRRIQEVLDTILSFASSKKLRDMLLIGPDVKNNKLIKTYLRWNDYSLYRDKIAVIAGVLNWRKHIEEAVIDRTGVYAKVSYGDKHIFVFIGNDILPDKIVIVKHEGRQSGDSFENWYAIGVAIGKKLSQYGYEDEKLMEEALNIYHRYEHKVREFWLNNGAIKNLSIEQLLAVISTLWRYELPQLMKGVPLTDKMLESVLPHLEITTAAKLLSHTEIGVSTYNRIFGTDESYLDLGMGGRTSKTLSDIIVKERASLEEMVTATVVIDRLKQETSANYLKVVRYNNGKMFIKVTGINKGAALFTHLARERGCRHTGDGVFECDLETVIEFIRRTKSKDYSPTEDDITYLLSVLSGDALVKAFKSIAEALKRDRIPTLHANILNKLTLHDMELLESALRTYLWWVNRNTIRNIHLRLAHILTIVNLSV